MKIDLHVHSKYSMDSMLNLRTLRKVYNKKGIVPIITDHGTTKGNERFKCKIMAEEIKTQQGELIGLFMTEEIKPLQPLDETLDLLKQQGALVMVPHPFDPMRRSSLKKITFKPDIIEVFNSRTILDETNKNALSFANKNNFLKAVGSDAHSKLGVGKAYNEIEDFNSKKEFLKNLKDAKFFCQKSSKIVHPYGIITRFFRKVF